MGLDLALGVIVLLAAIRGWLKGFVLQAIRLSGAPTFGPNGVRKIDESLRMTLDKGRCLRMARTVPRIFCVVKKGGFSAADYANYANVGVIGVIRG